MHRAPHSRKKSWKLKLLLAPLVLFMLVSSWFKIHHHPATSPVTDDRPAVNQSQSIDQNGTIRIIASGDMLPHDAINKNAQTNGGYDYTPFFSQVKSYLNDSDVEYCNQESPSASSLPISGYPTFNAPQAFPKALSDMGCNVINLANNHADDKGQAGIDQTLAAWKALNPLAIAGTNSSAADQQNVSYFTIKDMKFAYIGYAECSNNTGVSAYGLNLLSNSDLVRSQVKAARQNADFVIAGVHSCSENTRTPDSTIDQWTQYFADNGVNAIIGTGPHWLQSVKRLPRSGGGETVVWYSLGNFLSAQLDINGLIGGIAVMNVDAKSHDIRSIGFLPTYMHYEWTAQQKASQDLLARHDFKLYPLDQAAAAMADSQDNTTVGAQTKIVTDLMNQNTPVTMLTSKTYAGFH